MTAATFITVAKLAFTTFSTVSAMKSAKDEGKAKQAQADANARFMEQEARREQETGAINARRIRADTEAALARGRAIRGGGGGDPWSGSSLLVQSDLADKGEFQALLAENNTDNSVYGKTEQARLTRIGGANAATAGRTRAGNALLSGGASFAKTDGLRELGKEMFG
jgi:hypothetical protein